MRFFLGVLVMAVLFGSVQSGSSVPDNLKPPATEKLVLHVHAEGDQVYSCDGSSWALVGPDAKLFDESGKQIGTHYAGPTWESVDGSRVAGSKMESATPDPDSIPWLLLKATDHQGNGVMKQVTYIQRLSTKGGKPPATGCDLSRKGEKSRSHYTATYYFYAPNK